MLALPILDLDPPPMVSVVCPVLNERAFIHDVVIALERQTYPADRFEVVVVDGRSDDGTAEWVRERAASSPISIRIVDNPRTVTPVALNLGVEAAKGEIIVLVGGHSVVADDFIERSVHVLATSRAACAGGRVETVGHGLVARAIAIAQSSTLGVGSVSFRTVEFGSMPVDTVAFGAYRREVFDQIGLFDEELVRNQDDEFNFRLTQAGGAVWFDSSIRSRYHSRATLGRLGRQYFEYGKYKVRVIQKRRGVPSPRHLVPATAVVVMTGALLVGAMQRRPAVPAVVVGAYVAGCAGGALWEGRRDPSTIPVLPAAFMALHLPYGTGFLAGLWKWRRTWRAWGGSVNGTPDLEAAYRSYGTSDKVQKRWAATNPGNRAIHCERNRGLEAALTRAVDGLDPVRLVEVGCGEGALLRELADMRPLDGAWCCGVELLGFRIAEARQREPDRVLAVGDGAALPIRTASVDVIVLATILSSVSPPVAQHIAAECNRVLLPGGTVILYDMRYPSPTNRNVRPIRRRAIGALFPDYAVDVAGVTVVPQLARRLGRFTDRLYPLLRVVPFLRSHVIASLRKP